MVPKNSSMFHGDLPQFPLPCNTSCNYRRTKTMQCFDWSKDVESFSLQSPRDPTTDQWKTSILLFPLHLHPLGFAVLWISAACILPLLRSCLWTSIVLEGKNKMLTKAATPWHFLPLREANAGQRRREQLILSVHPGELSPNHETKENSKATSRSYYWLPQLWIRGRDKPSLKTVTQPKPNSMRPFSLWCTWKQDKGTTLNTGTRALSSTRRDAEAGDRSHAAAGTDWPAWKLAELESRIFATCQNIKGLFSTMAFNPSASIIFQGCTQTVYKLCHLVPRRWMKHSPPCPSEGNKKSGLNIFLLLFQLTLSYYLCNYKFLSKFCPITINWAQHICLYTYSELMTTWGKLPGSEHGHCVHPAIIKVH